MPNRIIREGWLESEAIDKLDAAAERFFLRLCLRADDYGRYHANTTLLRSNLFPLKEDVRSTDIPRWLAACEKAGLLRCYSCDGKAFLEIWKFNQRTRAEKSKFPDPMANDGPLSDISQTTDGQPRTFSETETFSKTETKCEGARDHAVACPPAADAPLIIPMLLNTPEFLGPWAQWQEIRRKGKKPKSSWPDYFAKQLKWLEQFGHDAAAQIVANSARNEWQGLFELKNGNTRAPAHRPAGEFDDRF